MFIFWKLQIESYKLKKYTYLRGYTGEAMEKAEI